MCLLSWDSRLHCSRLEHPGISCRGCSVPPEAALCWVTSRNPNEGPPGGRASRGRAEQGQPAIWDRLPGKVHLKAVRWAAWGGALKVTPEQEHRCRALSFCQKHLFARVFHQATQKHQGWVTVQKTFVLRKPGPSEIRKQNSSGVVAVLLTTPRRHPFKKPALRVEYS